MVSAFWVDWVDIPTGHGAAVPDAALGAILRANPLRQSVAHTARASPPTASAEPEMSRASPASSAASRISLHFEGCSFVESSASSSSYVCACALCPHPCDLTPALAAGQRVQSCSGVCALHGSVCARCDGVPRSRPTPSPCHALGSSTPSRTGTRPPPTACASTSLSGAGRRGVCLCRLGRQQHQPAV